MDGGETSRTSALGLAVRFDSGSNMGQPDSLFTQHAESEFAQFWAKYPRKVGRLAAQQKFQMARRSASLEAILAGVDRYIQRKPAYADWCHPKTWLSQGRWMDEYGETRQTNARDAYMAWAESGGCRHSPRCGNYTTCLIVSMRQSKAS